MGRPKGSKNKRPALLRYAHNDVKMTPLQYMLDTLANEDLEDNIRMDAAKSAAPYIHPRMTLELAGEQPPKTIEEVRGRLLEHGINPETALPRLISGGKGS
jgi:hypothetical protein